MVPVEFHSIINQFVSLQNTAYPRIQNCAFVRNDLFLNGSASVISCLLILFRNKNVNFYFALCSHGAQTIIIDILMLCNVFAYLFILER